MSERQINIFPYAFNLASLIIAGNQTNPLIKDFLKQFPISSNDQANNQSLSTDKINNFAGIEAQLDEDKDIKGITSRIDEISNQRGDDLYKELKDYPVKRSRTGIERNIKRRKEKEDRTTNVERTANSKTKGSI